MKGILIKGHLFRLEDVENTLPALKQVVDGKIETVTLRDNGVMICDRDALPKDKPYNNLASLIAGTGIYGDALIVGADEDAFCDVPDPFLALLNFPEDYFKP